MTMEKNRSVSIKSGHHTRMYKKIFKTRKTSAYVYGNRKVKKNK